MKFLNFLFGNKQNLIDDFKNRDAIILDVRTPQEYKQGALKIAENIPLQLLSSKINVLKKRNKPIITCCASGMRSGRACHILKSHGIEALNGGGWQSLSKKL